MFLVFAKIGAFTLGGGYAMVPIMEREIVDRRQWLTREEFMDILIVAQSTPGLFAINMASHIGNKARGVVGGIIGSLGVALPSILAILLIAMFFRAFQDNIYVERIFMGVRPAVVALIAAPCFSMARSAHITLSNLWIPIVACLLITLFGISPIWIILVAGLAGFVWGRVKRQPPTDSPEGANT
jgi:chromate transporter